MTRYILLLLIFYVIEKNSSAQGKLPTGLYVGGTFDENVGANYGQWIIKDNGDFVLFRLSNDMLVSLSQGTWRIDDSIIYFTFSNAVEKYTKRYGTPFRYTSRSQKSSDSIYFSGKVTFSNGQPVKEATIILKPGLATSTNSNGYFEKTVSQSEKNLQFSLVTKDGLYNVRLGINENSNYHKFDLIFPANVSDYFEPNQMSTYELKVDFGNNHSQETLRKSPFKASMLVKKLQLCRKNQPWLRQQISILLNELAMLQ